MRHSGLAFSCALTLLAIAQPSSGQGPAAKDPVIVDALGRIDTARIRATIEKLASFGTRHALSDAKIPGRGVQAAGDWLFAEFAEAAKASEGRMTVAFDDFDPREFMKGERAAAQALGVDSIRNVVAKLEGSDPGRVIIVSGHYDSRVTGRFDVTSDAPGANDDASGTAVVLELARALAPVRTRASIWFACVTAEELGLWGSTHLARRCDAEGVEVEAMITNDIVGGARDDEGRSEDDLLRVFSEGRPQIEAEAHPRRRELARGTSESDSPSRQWARYLKVAAATYVPSMRTRLVFRQDRFLRGGDHRPFNELGYTAIRLTEPRENFNRQHQDLREVDGYRFGDLPEYVDFAYVGRVAQVNGAAILSLAQAPRPAAQLRVKNTLSNATTLSWTTAEDPAIKGFRLLMRRTDEAEWTTSRDFGPVQTVEVPESKDDWLFAIQCLDAKGNASLPVFARP